MLLAVFLDLPGPMGDKKIKPISRRTSFLRQPASVCVVVVHCACRTSIGENGNKNGGMAKPGKHVLKRMVLTVAVSDKEPLKREAILSAGF